MYMNVFYISMLNAIFDFYVKIVSTKKDNHIFKYSRYNSDPT